MAGGERRTGIDELADAIAHWETAVRWIARGWDCLEEYTHDLMNRELVEEALARFRSADDVPAPLLARIDAADAEFHRVTEASDRCVWQDGSRVFGSTDAPSRNPYDPETFWYYYRWPPIPGSQAKT